MARLLPDRAAAALARAHRALPAPVHAAAFDDGSGLLTLAGTRDAATPGALEASHELYRETLGVTRGVRVCAALVLWRAASTHAWLTAFCAVLVLDCVDVYRAVFEVASQRALTKREETETWETRERLARDVVGLARLAAFAGAVRAEASAMIDSFDPIAMALEEGSAGAYTVKEHLCGCSLTAAWFALVAAAAAPKLRRVASEGTALLFARFCRAVSGAVSDVHDDVHDVKQGKGADDNREDGWCGPDREYWSLFALGGGARRRARARSVPRDARRRLRVSVAPLRAVPDVPVPGDVPGGDARARARARRRRRRARGRRRRERSDRVGRDGRRRPPRGTTTDDGVRADEPRARARATFLRRLSLD